MYSMHLATTGSISFLEPLFSGAPLFPEHLFLLWSIKPKKAYPPQKAGCYTIYLDVENSLELTLPYLISFRDPVLTRASSAFFSDS